MAQIRTHQCKYMEEKTIFKTRVISACKLQNLVKRPLENLFLTCFSTCLQRFSSMHSSIDEIYLYQCSSISHISLLNKDTGLN